ncbi:MAG: glycosyltransferase, partial [Anaerolineales bacterium]
MRILYIVDGRSPTARNWIAHFISAGHEVHMISTGICTRMLGLASLHILPVAFSDAGVPDVSDQAAQVNRRDLLRKLTPMWLRTFVRQWIGPLTVPQSVGKLQALIEQIQPDLVHAMRYPYEGILAARAEPSAPLIVSVWGNDFTLHAK